MLPIPKCKYNRTLILNLHFVVPFGSKASEHIIIGTPGKVQDWAFRYKCFDLSKIRVFVLDEADVMIATQGYGEQSVKIHR